MSKSVEKLIASDRALLQMTLKQSKLYLICLQHSFMLLGPNCSLTRIIHLMYSTEEVSRCIGRKIVQELPPSLTSRVQCLPLLFLSCLLIPVPK